MNVRIFAQQKHKVLCFAGCVKLLSLLLKIEWLQFSDSKQWFALLGQEEYLAVRVFKVPKYLNSEQRLAVRVFKVPQMSKIRAMSGRPRV